jgi:20S proteasome subunit beta 4
MEFKNGVRLNTEQTANFVRSELAEALRRGPYMVNCILGGFDADGPKLYWIDYLGTIVETEKAAHGYAEYFVYSVMDTLNKAVNQ